MQYKTIVLELIQEECPTLHNTLRANRLLLQVVNDSATALKRYHETWTDRLSQSKPQSDPMQISSEALELAIQELREDLLSESLASGEDAFSIEQAMIFLQSHSQPA